MISLFYCLEPEEKSPESERNGIHLATIARGSYEDFREMITTFKNNMEKKWVNSNKNA